MKSLARHGALALVVACFALYPTEARSQADLNGLWRVSACRFFPPPSYCLFDEIWSMEQMRSNALGFHRVTMGSATGFLHLPSGGFTLTWPEREGSECPPSFINATASSISPTWSGYLSVPFYVDGLGCGLSEVPITGKRCGNGVLDSGEQCDPGEASDPGCVECKSLTPTPPTSTPTVSPSATATPTPTRSCDGDCDGDGKVDINELVVGLSIALGLAEPDECAGLDADASGSVTVDELVHAVQEATRGCALMSASSPLHSWPRSKR